MSLRAVERILCAAIALSPLSCANAAPADLGYGNDDAGSSDDGGASGDGTTSTSGNVIGTMAPGVSQDAGPSQAGSSDAGAPQPVGHDAGSPVHPDAGGPPPPTTDASTPTTDAATPMGDGGPCTPNLGCMLSPGPSTGDIRQDCVNRVNQFRTQCACLPALQRWNQGEACADQQAQYDSQQMSGHAGFIATETACGQMSSMWAACCTSTPFGSAPSANAQDECPGYPNNMYVISACLQSMWSEGPPPNGVQACMADNTCFEKYGHFINMSSTMSTKVACGFYTTPSGQVWATQNFAP